MKKNKGFTLVELMVVIVIIGILAALAIPKLLAATSKAKLSEFKPVLKSIYTLQETHYQEAGKYSKDSTAIGFKTPGGSKQYFTYALDSAAILGKATTGSGQNIKLSNGESIGTSTLTACVDTTGFQGIHSSHAQADQIAKDAGLLTNTGATAKLSCGS